jgi:photosystem II stability/assembly factor-like uncharacterized protein
VPSGVVGYAVGMAGKIFKTTDAGTTWAGQTLQGNIAGRNYNAVFFTDLTHGIAVGGNQTKDSIQTILQTTDGGLNWNTVTDNLGAWLLDVTFADMNHGFAVGELGKVLKTSDGGATWTTVSIPSGQSTRRFTGVHFFDSQTGIVVGGYPTHDSIQTILKTTDGGTTWNIVLDNLGSMLKTIHFINSTEGYAAGNDGTLLHTNDQGNTWSPLIVSGNDRYALFSVYFNNPGFGITVGKYGKALVYRNTGLVLPTTTVTTPVTLVNATTVAVQGQVNANGLSTTVVFEYGTSMSFGTTLSMTPSSTSGNAVGVTVTITGLSALNSYYGRIKVSNLNGTAYSSVVQFSTHTLVMPTVTMANPVSILNSNTAKIQGTVSANGSTIGVEFEYGTSMAFGTKLAMTPSSTSANTVPVSLTLTGLNPGMLYYGRMKVSNAQDTAYSSVAVFSTNISEVPNFGFEYWNVFSTQLLSNWATSGIITRVLSYDGSYAAKMKGTTNGPGAVVYAAPNGGAIHPLPYTSRPDSIIVYGKYDVEPTDSAVVYLKLSAAGVSIGTAIRKLGGSSNSLFERIALKINYVSSSTPDSLELLFLSTDYLAGHKSVISELTIDNVDLKGNGAIQLPNSNFESWNLVSRSAAVSWWSPDDQNYNPGDSTDVNRSTDAFSGNYALLLRNNIPHNSYGYLSSAIGYGGPKPSFPVTVRHQTFNGFYKFTSDANDTLFVSVYMFNHGTIVGSGWQAISQSTSVYKSFDVPINYMAATAPDSSSVSFSIGKNQNLGNTTTPGNSFALLDNLTFDGLYQPASVQEIRSFLSANVFPNPVTDRLTVSLVGTKSNNAPVTIQIVDLTGRVIRTLQEPAADYIQIEVSDLASQMYLLRMTVEGKTITSRFIKTL